MEIKNGLSNDSKIRQFLAFLRLKIVFMVFKSMKKYMKSLATVAALMLLPLSVRSEWFFTDLNKKNAKN